MAFVINKSEYKSVFEQVTKTPGPGTYQRVQTSKQQNPAPFNASSSKLSCFNIKESNLGPGSYSKTSLHQCFKNKSTCSSSFKSQAPRFPYQSKSQKGIIEQPPQLQSQKSLLTSQNTNKKNAESKFNENKLKQKKQYLLNLRKKNQQRKTNSIVSEQKGKIRILISNPKNTQNIQSFYIEQFMNIKQNNGPGAYEVTKSLVQKNKSIIDWSKDKQKRFRKSKSISSHVGPGYYEIDKKPKTFHHKRNTSSFSSGQVRTFLDTLVYRTKSLTKVQLMQSRGIVQSSPGPGQYSPQKPQRDSFYQGRQIMSSTVQRFTIDKNKSSTPGPGFYKNSDCMFKYQGMVKQMRQKIFGKQTIKNKDQKQQGFMSLEEELKNLKQQTKKDFYHVVPYTLKQRCQSKAGTLGHQARFKDIIKSKIKVPGPGPGQYLSLYQNKQPPQNSSIFKSCTERQPFIINQQSIEKPFYEVGKQDIGVRTQKVRQNIKSLKKVAIQKPAFDSSVLRFPSEEISKTQPSTVPQPINGALYQRDQIDYDSFKPYKQKSSYGSVFRSTTTRNPFAIKNNPGPGSYENQDLLNKKSYNAQYYLIDREKALSTSKLELC